MQRGHLAESSGTGAVQNTQNLNPGGGVTGPSPSDRKRLARAMIPPPAARGRLQKNRNGSGTTKRSAPKAITSSPPTKSWGRIPRVPRQCLYSFDTAREILGLTTEYEQLLSAMIVEKKAKVSELTGKRGKEKQLAGLQSDIRFLEVEIERYQQGMALFRSRNLPRVGRWGRAETEETKEEP